MWKKCNPNPCRMEEPDCVVRAIAIATGRTWDEVHLDLCVLSHRECTMPSVNWLWGKYLTEIGFERFELPHSCPECMTVREFCELFPKGRYVLATGYHAVATIDGDYLDTWDSGDEIPTYFFRKRKG